MLFILQKNIGIYAVASDETGQDLGRIILVPETFTVIGDGIGDGRYTNFDATAEGLVETAQRPTPTRNISTYLGNGNVIYRTDFGGPTPEPIISRHGKGEDVIGFLKSTSDRIRNARPTPRTAIATEAR